MNTVTLGGTATINDLVSVARFGAKVAFSKEYEERVNHCRAHVDRFSHEGKAIYGLTTGLGDNWKKFIPEKDRETIQRNNIYAHTCAVGEPIAGGVHARNDVRHALPLRLRPHGHPS